MGRSESSWRATGCGSPIRAPASTDADLPYVFDRFFRSMPPEIRPGTGLGLSIVAQTIARHGGWVKAGRSAQGGAEFTIRLPGTTAVEELAQESPPAAAS